jgi:hypothetical protein
MSKAALKKAFTEHKDDLVFWISSPTRSANVFPMVAAARASPK